MMIHLQAAMPTLPIHRHRGCSLASPAATFAVEDAAAQSLSFLLLSEWLRCARLDFCLLFVPKYIHKRWQMKLEGRPEKQCSRLFYSVV